ncbi:DPS (DNA Protecting protein under Starved conditions) domain family protein [Flavobacterium indicum GPTSA100-9 = DSM 17447]|uniref:DPS (DNA Protecting protein under Starved conditions) domain family protein n=1 Tax=Flavobacterium indicum (strain DSM 17447 / CIP 109464 / GPTSA100-9) TaxID=1094466 RepID=H8XSL9_FLAIG|nr:Dps family protein [Flavobacterium indicum]CCG52604.1 DPS (DNA Protecting protein under Starved conditions) domain family protein [Flavobacterium indicum GPTSA100-9 = DSM 17447]
MKANQIGINTQKAETLAKELNILLANYSLFYQNVRGCHWNIKGNKFFELHVKFEELYNDLIIKIDDIAERILTLGFNPDHQFSNYLEVSTIKELKETSKDTTSIESIVNSFSILITLQRDILKLAQETEDEGTASLMSDNIREQEKLIWMYNSYLG